LQKLWSVSAKFAEVTAASQSETVEAK